VRFDNKVAIVTGSAGGIGEAYARALAREGAAVVVADIDATRGKAVAADIVAGGGRSLFVATDVSSVESAAAAAEATTQAFGRLDYLVNNAALFAGMRL
jgi:NAD(P)-dependent dehydrogenase (short-subunit alcohol dehydrogenase family)